MTPPRKRPVGPARPRTAAEWIDSELYVGPRPPLTGWERYGPPLVVLVVVGLLLVAWLVWGGRG